MVLEEFVKVARFGLETPSLFVTFKGLCEVFDVGIGDFATSEFLDPRKFGKNSGDIGFETCEPDEFFGGEGQL